MPADVKSAPDVTIILPHRERFESAGAGAVALVVRGLAGGKSRFRPLVIGPPVSGASFPGIAFLPARAPRWLPLSGSQQYIVAVVRLLARLSPGLSPGLHTEPSIGLIEVHNKPEIALWLSRRFPGRPITLHLHNEPRTMRGASSPAARRRLLRRLARVIAVSDHVRRAFLEGIGPTPAGREPIVLPNAIDLTVLPPSAAERDKTILFAGRVVPDKAPDAFVAACARALPLLPGWRAEIIGADGFSADTPDSEFIRRLRPQAATAGVVMHGFQPHDVVLAALSRAAIAVVPSRWEEPFGLAALEAMACGAALACSMRGGLAEVAGDAAIPIDPDDTEQFAAALLKMATDPALRASLAEAGRQRVIDLFSLTDAKSRLDDLRAEAAKQRIFEKREQTHAN